MLSRLTSIGLLLGFYSRFDLISVERIKERVLCSSCPWVLLSNVMRSDNRLSLCGVNTQCAFSRPVTLRKKRKEPVMQLVMRWYYYHGTITTH